MCVLICPSICLYLSSYICIHASTEKVFQTLKFINDVFLKVPAANDHTISMALVVYVCIYIYCVRVYIYIYMCVYIYIYIHIYLYTYS